MALWSLLTLILVTLLSPLRLCINAFDVPISNVKATFASFHSVHYYCVFHNPPVTDAERSLSLPSPVSPLEARLSTHHNLSLRSIERLNLFSLLIIIFWSPVAALGTAFAAWITTFFWILSVLTANEQSDGPGPDGPRFKDTRGYDDGRCLARSLVAWWVWWLDGRCFQTQDRKYDNDMSERR